MDTITINGRKIGKGSPVYIIAELSANHNQDISKAFRLIEAAKAAGADAVKIQTYTADTMTLDSDREYFRIKGTVWNGQKLYDLYRSAYTPWEWQGELKAASEKMGMDFFSTPFDATAVDFLEKIGVSFYKIASFELVDIPLLRKVAATGKPVIMSTGMAEPQEIQEALDALRSGGCPQVALLKCTSSYPAPPEDMNLRAIQALASKFNVPAGISDHSLQSSIAVAAVALGASIVEKHFTLSRGDKGPDSSFSAEPEEFKAMVDDIRTVEKALGTEWLGVTEREKVNRVFRRSLFAVKDIRKGEALTEDNVRSIRPAYGMHPRYMSEVIGKKAARDISAATPLSPELIENFIY